MVKELRTSERISGAVGWQEDDACPRCAGKDFKEHDSGPDGWDDDITYTSTECLTCGLWYSGWTDAWYVDCESWQGEENDNLYCPSNPQHAVK